VPPSFVRSLVYFVWFGADVSLLLGGLVAALVSATVFGSAATL
jgi:hypothetical protein